MSISIATFLDLASVYPQDLDLSVLKSTATHWQWREHTAQVEVASALKGAEVVVVNKVVLTDEHLKQASQLRLICVAATGVNNIDLVAANKYGIKVCNVQAYATPSVVQHVFLLIFALNRRLLHYHQSARNGDWSNSDYFCYFGEPFDDLAGKTLGVIGYGELGRAVAEAAECFGMDVLIARRQMTDGKVDARKDRVGLKHLLSASDIVTLHCPLTEHNHHLIGSEELKLMKPESVLINTARGGLVDERALFEALAEKKIAGAGLDVLSEEPPAENHALLNAQFKNLIITPHIAWASKSSRQRLVDEVAKNIQAFQQGQSRNIVQTA